MTTICRLCKSCKVSDNAFMKFTMDMINIWVYNHPSKHFAREGLLVVVALERIRGARCGWLWKGVKWAWWWWFKDEVAMLIYRVISFRLQSQCLTRFPSPMVFLSRGSSWKIMVVSRSRSRTTKCGCCRLLATNFKHQFDQKIFRV